MGPCKYLLQELIIVGVDLGEARQPAGSRLAGCCQVQTRDGKDTHRGVGGREEGWPVDQLSGPKSSLQGTKDRRPIISEQRNIAVGMCTTAAGHGQRGELVLQTLHLPHGALEESNIQIGTCPTGCCAALREPWVFMICLLGLLGLQLK